MSWKKIASLVAAASMAVAVAPAAAAQTDTVTQETSVTYTCRGNDSGNAPGSPGPTYQ